MYQLHIDNFYSTKNNDYENYSTKNNDYENYSTKNNDYENKIHIFQHGTDGFGHQLEGFFTCLIMHNVNNYYFDAIEFINKNFEFEHVDIEQSLLLKEYFVEVANQMINEYGLSKINYKNIIRSHEIWNIPNDYENDVLYSLDNNFFYKKLFNDPITFEKIDNNINLMKNYFINSKLPPNKLKTKNIVLHCRLGDANNRNGIEDYKNKILLLIDVFKIKYPEYIYYIHSDGEPNDIIDKINGNYHYYNKDTPVLNVLSDFIHSTILICGVSSFSYVCSYFGNKELVIVNDDIDRFDNSDFFENKNIYKITDYLQKFS
jgi:hypothetical protein